MRFAYRDACLDHDTGPRHPENADRLRAIQRGLAREHGVRYADPDDVDVDLVKRVHDRDYVDRVEEFCADGGGTWDADTVAVEATWDAARVSAGAAVWAAAEALDGAAGRDTAFSIGRPPGHHATVDDAMGFCFFNNVAVAAQHALEAGSDRVAVFDWDVHHGNGTQDIFYDRDDVLYASIHERGIFPGSGEVRETGTEAGVGTTVNVPFPPGSDDAAYATVFDEVLSPVIERSDPDLLLVSAGFDAHERDPISRMRLSTEGFGLLADRCDGLTDDLDAALAFVLEGGYGLEPLAESVRMLNEVFEGREPVEPDGDVARGARDVIDEVRDTHGCD